MTRPSCVPVLLAAACAALSLAGCASEGGGDGDEATGTFSLGFTDNLAEGRLDISGAFLHSNATAGGAWVAALGNGSLAFDGSGANVTAEGEVPAGEYDGIRVLFKALLVGDRPAKLAQSGIEVAVDLTVPEGGRTDLNLTVAWADALFESQQGLAFDPVLSRLVVEVDGVETERLEEAAIRGGGGLAPVARMRVFDATGLEAFASTFVADSPEDPVVANAGELTLSATGSEALVPGATLASHSWDIGGTELKGSTVRHTTPISGGNLTVRLTVTDSEGGSDTQTVKLAVKPGRAERSFNFTGSVTGANGQGAGDHQFPVNVSGLDGAPARLVHLVAVLEPGASAVPVADLDLAVLDGAGAQVAAATGAGSQHRIDQEINGQPAAGDWTVRVIPRAAVSAAYTVTVTLTWQGVNPGMEAFLAEYDDGHTHEH